MRKVWLVAFCLLFPLLGYAQQTITGTIYDDANEPLIGCSIHLEGTTTGTITDIDGKFSLVVPNANNLYLQVSYIGYITERVKITGSRTAYEVRMREGSYGSRRAVNYIKKKPVAVNDMDAYQVKDIRGRLVHSASTDSYIIPLAKNTVEVPYKGTRVQTDKGGYFYLKAVVDSDLLKDPTTGESYYVAQVTDSVLREYPEPVFSTLTVNKTDTLGVLYMNEDMPVSYTGGIYLDKIKNIRERSNGTFTMSEAKGRYKTKGHRIFFTSYLDVGTVGKLPDSGMAAGEYNPKDFFRTGVSFGNFLNANLGAFGSSTFSLKLGQNRNNSTIPHAYKESYNASFALENMKFGTFESEVGLMLKSSYGKLTQQGANLSSLLYNTLADPKELPDRNKNDDMLTYLKVKKNFRKVETNTMFSYDKQWDKKHSGTLNNATLPYRLSYRNLNSSNAIAKTDINWAITDRKIKADGILSYGFKHTAEKLNRSDLYGQTNPSQYLEHNKLIRNAHDLRYGVKLNAYRKNVILEIYNKHYFSNTAKQADYVNLFPELGFSWNMEDVIRNVFHKHNQYLTLYASVGRSIGESSLIYRNPAILSTIWNANDFRMSSEHAEMYNYKGLKPETYLKSEAGIRYSSGSHFSGEANVFYYHTQNYIAPVMASSREPILNNVGRLRNYGYYLSGRYYKNGYGRYVGMDIQLNFSQSRNKVSSVYGNRTVVPLAGFSDVQTVFAKNQPLGAIYGMVDNTLQKIGDPTPEFIVTLNPKFWWKGFDLSFVLDYNHGGDRWNGTQAMFNQSLSPSGGQAGIGKEYIQDASFLRLSNVMLSYSVFKDRYHRFFKSMSINAQAQNLFVLSPYKGVDPSSLLFGYTSGYGLDMFNLPNTRSYILSLTFQF